MTTLQDVYLQELGTPRPSDRAVASWRRTWRTDEYAIESSKLGIDVSACILAANRAGIDTKLIQFDSSTIYVFREEDRAALILEYS